MLTSENECGCFHSAISPTYASGITYRYSWYNVEGRESSRAPCHILYSIATGGIGLRRWSRSMASRHIEIEKSNASRENKAGIRVIFNEVAQ